MPTYANNDSSSEMWREACVRSQEWASGARLRSRKRHRKFNVIVATMMLGTLALATLILFMTDKIQL